jgi:hypothetical protein
LAEVVPDFQTYVAVQARIREQIDNFPADDVVLVASAGDEGFCDGRETTWHFPRTPEGHHAGNPSDSSAAIAQLEALRSQGARWLVLPATQYWWLDVYGEFHAHLVSWYDVLPRAEACLVFDLAGPTLPDAVANPAPTPAELLLRERPRLHDFAGQGELVEGGLSAPMAHRLVAGIREFHNPVVLETGAGLSTLLFCCLAPRRVISMEPNAQLWERIFDEAERRSISTAVLRDIRERSEVALPPLAASGETIDVAFIDGDHGWPSVFVDFCYANIMLRKGGLLFLDDVHLYSVRQLVLLLLQEAEFEYAGTTQKLAVFRKRTDERFLSSSQPFIRANTMHDEGRT